MKHTKRIAALLAADIVSLCNRYARVVGRIDMDGACFCAFGLLDALRRGTAPVSVCV